MVDICVVAVPPAGIMSMRGPPWRPGAHVLVEKPFTIDPADAWDLANTAKRLGLHLLVAFGANYQPMIRGAKQLMATDGGIGEVEHVMIHMASAIREAFRGRPARTRSTNFPKEHPNCTPIPTLGDAGTRWRWPMPRRNYPMPSGLLCG